MQQVVVVAVAQEIWQEVAIKNSGAAETTKPGVADGGVRSPVLTGERRPLYRLCNSDVVGISFVFTPEFNQAVSVQPDGFVALQGVEQLYAEGMTLPEFREAIRGLYARMLHDPEVTVILKDFNKPYFIAGLSLALDAMGAGVCVLTSDIAENCELVEGAGFTFKRGDANDLERMLRWLISDSSARLMAAGMAQKRVREHYLWPVIAKDVERAYWRTMGRQDVSVELPESPITAELGAPRPDMPEKR
jgi:glycosyltransferase involved in cell wall biosynthesis